MKRISTLILLAFACNLASAQTDENRKAAFQFSLFTPIGTNGAHSAITTNEVSFNLLVGVSKNEEALTMSGFSSIILNNARGIQMAGLSNYVGNEGSGVQMAGLINTNKGAFSGLQFAGLVNSAADVKGAQFAGLVNVAEDIQGSQFAGLVNSAGDIKGAQFAGLVNTAKDIKSSQFAGLVNIAKDVKGVQFAGIINIAENSDVPIGLINIIKNGEIGMAVTYDGIGNTVASFRSGGKYTYGIFGVGYNHKVVEEGLVTEGGLGVHIPITKRFRINNELKTTIIGDFIDDEIDDAIFNYGYSLLPAFRIGDHFELFAGASINYIATEDMSKANIFPNQSLWKMDSARKLEQVYIGYQVGMQFIF